MTQADIDRNEIIEMARQIYGTDKWNVGQLKRLEAFAKLVAAAAASKEREACAQIADRLADQDLEHNFSALIAHNIRNRGER